MVRTARRREIGTQLLRGITKRRSERVGGWCLLTQKSMGVGYIETMKGGLYRECNRGDSQLLVGF